MKMAVSAKLQKVAMQMLCSPTQCCGFQQDVLGRVLVLLQAKAIARNRCVELTPIDRNRWVEFIPIDRNRWVESEPIHRNGKPIPRNRSD